MSETTDTSTGTSPGNEDSAEALGFPLKGTLRRNPFPKLVRQLARTKSTGSLYLLNDKTKKVVFFEQGEPISVRSNVTAECLGQILAREGLITQAQCDQTLESIRRTGKKQGELLIEMGILSEGNLRYGLEAQLRHKLFDIFAWDDARYQYKPDLRGDDYGLRFNTHAQGLILNALLETTDEARARASLDPYAERFPVIDQDHGVPLELIPEEDYFLTCLDGSRSIAELLEPDADLASAVPSPTLLLYASIQAGLAKLAKSRRPLRPRPAKPEDDRVKPDRELEPSYTPRLTVTTYEDTPLPGELPKAPNDDLDDFGVDDPEPATREVSSLLVAAERDTPDETFDEDLSGIDEAPLIDLIGQGALVSGVPLVADPAESGVFERALVDDDDQPFGSQDDEPATVEHERAPDDEPATVEHQRAPDEDPTDEDPTVEVGASPFAGGVTDELAERQELDDEIEELDELHEIEELDELHEIDELDELETEAHDAVPDEIAPDNTPDTGVPSRDREPERSPEPLAATESLAREDELAALADLEVDDDLALDGSLGDALSVLDDELPLDDNSLDHPLDAGALAEDDEALAEDDELAAGAAELLGLDDLDDIDLGSLDEDEDESGEAVVEIGYDPDATADADSETIGVLHFSDGETAIGERRWAQAISHFETAYGHGIDIAELHTLLAWGRFQASGESPEMADHACELLAYAEEMNPNLAMVHAYRSAVLLAAGDPAGAQDAAQRALDIDPYDEMAIDVMDKLV